MTDASVQVSPPMNVPVLVENVTVPVGVLRLTPDASPTSAVQLEVADAEGKMLQSTVTNAPCFVASSPGDLLSLDFGGTVGAVTSIQKLPASKLPLPPMLPSGRML